MKNLILLTLVLFVLNSCCSDDPNNQRDQCTDNHWSTIKEFQYKGHDYIRFGRFRNDSSTEGVVHNPECKKCQDGKESIISD